MSGKRFKLRVGYVNVCGSVSRTNYMPRISEFDLFNWDWLPEALLFDLCEMESAIW